MTRNAASNAQVDAADPNASTWLSANAGSGKTRVLTDRVARLLLIGTNPQNILCLTYTKAAASEMQNRLFKRLGEWAMMPTDALRKQLVELGVDDVIDQDYLDRARKLFAAAIETPGGLKIQTIHSFCAGILRRFPMEAAVNPQFREMEDHEADLLRLEVFEKMAEGEDQPYVDAFAAAFTGAEVNGILREITGNRTQFPKSKTEISAALRIPQNATPQMALDIAFEGDEESIAQSVAHAFQTQSDSYKKFAASLLALDLKAPNWPAFEALCSLLLYADKTSKSRNFPQKNHKKVVEAAEPIVEDLHAWMDRVAEAYDFLRALRVFERTVVLHDFAARFIAHYEEKKRARGALDFDDLILNTRSLLSDPLVAQWVLFRLDGGVDHILVDEAQDTSPDQWHVIDLLTKEFTSGEGAFANRKRSIFVVGDKKQSIYSFQGADPEEFDRMRAQFSGALSDIGKVLQERELLYSFRSSSAVLHSVDQVFLGPNAEGVGDTLRHIAFHEDMPGRVDLWPVVETTKEKEPDWTDPLDKLGETHHTIRLAQQIASEIKRMIEEETLPEKRDGQWVRRPITPGDFLILVRGRKELFREIISACKALELDIAGADRMKLGNELAVKDILALLRFLALPEDDLALAEALKSPLFGWGEKQLYDLAQPRPKGQTLWEALRKSKDHHTTKAILDDLRGKTDYLRPYDLINRILLRHNGRRNLVARLGVEAEDGIDALLSQALVFEQSTVPSLTGFLIWFEAEEIEVKRQMDAAGDRIRVMTVHGAKGLEAPIVILPDTTSPKRQLRSNVLTNGDAPIWTPKTEDMPKAVDHLKEAALDAEDRESRRLLYVAMTRAERWLIVAAAGDVGDDGRDWYNMVSEALPHLGPESFPTSFGEIQRVSFGDWLSLPEVERQPVTPSTPISFGFSDAVPEPPESQRTLAPSDLGGAKALFGEMQSTTEDEALSRGRIIHKLLEVLPTIPGMHRNETASRLIAQHPDASTLSDHAALAREAIMMLTAPHLKQIFASGLTEVDITANLPTLGGRRIHGAIDRLIIDETRILAVDFKSNHVVPNSPDEVPDGLLRQMGAYRDALRQIYPQKTIGTALLWTATGELMHLTDQLLTEALAGVELA